MRVCFSAVWRAGIRNADPGLADLQGVCKRSLVLAVEMLLLFLEFASSLLEMVLFLMEIQGTPHKGVSWFWISSRKHVCMCCISF